MSTPRIYLHRFACGHSESYHGILVSDKTILTLNHPCARCEPHTTAGQEGLEDLWHCGGLYIPYLSPEGDIIVAPRGSKGFPAMLEIWESVGRWEVRVVREDSAEGMAMGSLYGVQVRGRG